MEFGVLFMEGHVTLLNTSSGEPDRELVLQYCIDGGLAF